MSTGHTLLEEKEFGPGVAEKEAGSQ